MRIETRTTSKEKMVRISIVVPVYKIKEMYIRQCIDSILNQTFHEWELILVDDGSPDNCGKICDAYAAKDSRIQVIHQKNQGVSAARNNGIMAASGKWLMFVDADDWLDHNTCELIYNAAEEYDCEFLMFERKLNYRNKEEEELISNAVNKEVLVFDTPERIHALQVSCLGKSYAEERIIRSTPQTITSPCAKLIKREYLQQHQIGFPEEVRITEDACFSLQLYVHAKKVVVLPVCLYHYRQCAGSVSYRSNSDYKHMYHVLLQTFYDILQDAGLHSSMQEAYMARIVLCADSCIKQHIFAGSLSGYFEKRRKSRNLVEKEPYYSAIKNIFYKGRTGKTCIKIFLLKYKLFGLLILLVKTHSYYQKRRLWE